MEVEIMIKELLFSKVKKISLVLVFIFITIFSFSQNCESERYKKAIFDNVTITENVVYSVADSYDILNQDNPEDYHMDIYEPTGDTQEKRPVVFMFFGGGFINGDKQDADMVAWCDSLARYGYVAVSVNYRLGFNYLDSGSPIRTVYRGVQDANAAIRYMLEFQNTYKIDPNHIYIGGKSAGAILAMHTVYFGKDADRPDQTFGTLLEPGDLGCVSCSGNNYQHTFDIKGIIGLWGAIIDTDEITVNEQIPAMMVHGEGDSVVPFEGGYPYTGQIQLTFPYVEGSKLIHERMDDLGIYNEFYPYDYDDHDVYGSNPFPNGNWEEIWTYGHSFWRDRVMPNTIIPQGESNPVTGLVYTYSVSLNDGSEYCWEVVDGTIISENENEIEIQWLQGMGSISVTEKNCIGAVGETMILEVDVTTNNENIFAIPNVNIFPTILKNEEEIRIENNFSSNENIQGIIYASSGKLMRKITVENNLIHIPNLPNGIYFLELIIGNKKGSYKFIKL